MGNNQDKDTLAFCHKKLSVDEEVESVTTARSTVSDRLRSSSLPVRFEGERDVPPPGAAQGNFQIAPRPPEFPSRSVIVSISL